jgi:restriction system protein
MRDLSARIANRQSVEGPASKIKMTPVKFEEYVRDWISANLEVDSAQVLELSHLGMIEGAGGTYKIDVLVKFSILKGARIIVLVECKHLTRPVERDEMQILLSKLQDVGAHKGIVFSTSGFQAGALEYAEVHGIAAVEVSRTEFHFRRGFSLGFEF